ncbi:MAG: DegT/DnrJ/EryC1/StrS family aminotransferase [Spirochaetia bacterium]|nr:DegT/DnrJ/EryC1/StrS family aminotransferase [Spirochaetia bacterium]
MNIEIPFFNYPALTAKYEEDILNIIKDVMRHGAFVLQKDLENFEENLRKFLNVKYAIGVSSGTSALIIALKAAGIKENDEVILPSYTHIATAEAVYSLNAVPVLADINDEHLIDIESIKKNITNKSKAIVPVHLNGRTCDMNGIRALAENYNLTIIEDASQAFGSKYKNQFAGTFGKAAAFSFYPSNILGCLGDGGCIVTNNEKIAEYAKIFRNHGKNKSGETIMWGINSRLDNIQAAVLNYKLKIIENEITRRREIANLYNNALNNLEEIKLPCGPNESENYFDIYQNYEIEINQRENIKTFLEKKGIQTVIPWEGKAVHHLNYFHSNKLSLPRTDNLIKKTLLLPMNTSLTDSDVNFICNTICRFYKG